MNKFYIDAIDKTGLAKTTYTTIERDVWHFDKEGNRKNYEELARLFDITPDQIVRIDQVHSDRYEAVTHALGGRFVTYDSDVKGDALITNEKGLLLCTLQADCTPVYMLDPVKKAIAMIHSGWRGTAAKISVKTLQGMQEHYGTDPYDVIVGIGPCICEKCYEVGAELKEEFLKSYTPEQTDRFFLPEYTTDGSIVNGKYMLDVKEAIRISLTELGVSPDRISDCGHCTFEEECFPSYRRQRQNTGRMLTGIMLL